MVSKAWGKYHFHSAPCWWPLSGAQTGRLGEQGREVISTDTRINIHS